MQFIDRTKITIREANPEDYVQIHSICENDLGYSCNRELVRKRLITLDKDRECVFVAILNDRVAGFIHVEKYEVLYCEPMTNILGLAVKKEFRRHGAGRELLNAAEIWAKDRGITMVRLNSGKTRTEAHEFYRNIGYGNEKEQLRFIKKL